MRFIADCMLGKLARKLRMLGYDTLYFASIEDLKLIWIAKNENRILLTKDTALAKRCTTICTIFLVSQKINDEIKELKKALPELSSEKSFTRCIECNNLLIPLIKDKLINDVPPYVFSTQNNFAYCEHCKRIYWKATHVENMIKQFEKWRL